VQSNPLGRALALVIGALTAFNTIAALSLPAAARPPAPVTAGLWLVLMLAGAAMYWFGDAVRRRIGLTSYVAIQALVVVVLGVTRVAFPVGLALLIALTAETIVVAAGRWNSVAITVGAIVLFGVTAIASSNLYQGARAGAILAATGVVAHAAAALLRTHRHAPVAAPSPTSPTRLEDADLTPREREVLQALVTGARNSEIATGLGITERTVKAHLASIYQRLGVTSRSAAIALVLKKGVGLAG
jgi:DNA-binding CsgD family transcriptional regulator